MDRLAQSEQIQREMQAEPSLDEKHTAQPMALKNNEKITLPFLNFYVNYKIDHLL